MHPGSQVIPCVFVLGEQVRNYMLGIVAYSPKQFGISFTHVLRSIPGIFREEAMTLHSV